MNYNEQDDQFYIELRQKLTYNNEEKQKIARDMLERYTGSSIDDFQQYILLTNFSTTSYILALSVFIVHCQLNKDTHLLYAVLAIISQQVGAEVLRWLVSIF